MTDNDRAAFEAAMREAGWEPSMLRYKRTDLNGLPILWVREGGVSAHGDEAWHHWRQTGSTPPPF